MTFIIYHGSWIIKSRTGRYILLNNRKEAIGNYSMLKTALSFAQLLGVFK